MPILIIINDYYVTGDAEAAIREVMISFIGVFMIPAIVAVSVDEIFHKWNQSSCSESRQ